MKIGLKRNSKPINKGYYAAIPAYFFNRQSGKMVDMARRSNHWDPSLDSPCCPAGLYKSLADQCRVYDDKR